jgi:TRAP transporter TAXI family solute receptor
VLRIKSLCLAVILLGSLSASADAQTGARSAEPAWLGLIAGPAAGSETMLAADMASLFAAGAPLRVVPMLGDAGAGNIAMLLGEPSVDLAVVSADALAAAKAQDAAIAERLDLVARLCPQEVHVLVGAGIASPADLAGKTVNFGPAGSGSAITASALFKALGLEVESLALEDTAAIERLKQGAISAAVIVGAKPEPLISALPASLGIRLLPLPFGASLEAAYLPTRFKQSDYPNLVSAGGEVPAVATGMVLLAARSKSDGQAQERIARFVDTLFPRFAELQAPDHHPKWREVNLAASLPGFRRTPAAEAWLAKRPAATVKPIAADIGAAPVLSQSLVMNQKEKERLFRQFIEWQRARGH